MIVPKAWSLGKSIVCGAPWERRNAHLLVLNWGCQETTQAELVASWRALVCLL